MAEPHFSLGLDFGTSSIRALVVSVDDGREVGLAAGPFEHGSDGVIGDSRDPNIARQHPGDYKTGAEKAIRGALAQAARESEFRPDRIVGIGVDATASTPIPVDAELQPLANRPEFVDDLNALAWLWKDHTAYAEAEAITEIAARDHPEYLARIGGTYSSEWLFAKLLHCLRIAPHVISQAADWIEQGDYIVGFLTGVKSVRELKRNVCAAGHKAMYSQEWGWPPLAFFNEVDPQLGQWCEGRLSDQVFAAGKRAGGLCPEWAERTGLPAGIPVSMAGIDAHVGAVGAGIRTGTLVKILGTSGCDMAVHPSDRTLPDIPGLCGIVQGSILPGYYGLEAGQPALGDLFGWFVRRFTRPAGLTHEDLTRDAAKLQPGESGLLALDWNNGNRCVLADPRLTGLLVGQTLQTSPSEVYRALLEAAAFGARTIMQRFEDHAVSVDQVVVCGGIAEKNQLLLQIYADVTDRPIFVSGSQETCALGAAILGSVAAGQAAGGHDSVETAHDAMSSLKEHHFTPNAGACEVYDELYQLYLELYKAFGEKEQGPPLYGVMKTLITIREKVRQQ